jgi:hypothetical protein
MFVHAKISNATAMKVGVKTYRATLLDLSESITPDVEVGVASVRRKAGLSVSRIFSLSTPKESVYCT